MPGLSQLKNFSQNLLSIGDEVVIRSNRGEKPVRVNIPKDIADVDDSEDFVLGMPENHAAQTEEKSDDDLSDLAGLARQDENEDAENRNENAPSFETPDLSSILNPISMENSGDENEMPDLSMFEDNPAEEDATEPEPETPEEIPIADMGLDALLASGGFDGSEGADFSQERDDEYFPADYEKNPENDDKNSDEDLNETSDFEIFDGDEKIANKKTDLNADETTPSDDDATDLPDTAEFNKSSSSDFDDIDANAVEPNVAGNLSDFDNATQPSVATDLSDLGDFDNLSDAAEPNDAENLSDLDNLAAATDLPDNLSDLGNPDDAKEQDADGANEHGDLSGLADMPNLDNLSDTSGLGNLPDAKNLSDLPNLSDSAGGEDSFGLDDIGDFSTGKEESSDFSVTDDIPDYNDSLFDNNENQNQNENETADLSSEDFDISAMENMDFGIAETDSKLNSDAENSDFIAESDFEIPGFSDVPTVKEEKKTPLLKGKKESKKSKKNISEADFSEAEESEELPPNALSDSQYKQFLKNLSEYPLNVRLAFENLIVQDEFTDDAEFEIIEKILKKAPARQIAVLLEKMLDVSIPVPRDYEHRTAEEYEAYKKSLSYQLRNRIIPACLIGITLFLVSLGLFHFSKNCIYKPLKANGLYKQGYALLEANEYPQAEMKFEQAVKYRVSKKWFFNYARGYRNHKQYQRAASMYGRILSYFKHDKAAGLEYADMELNDMANYERAEQVVRREVLDYHINDADGILKLGDIFLEWGTEKDPKKFDSAREQYANLLQLYGKDKKRSDLYLARMMRYFIRTDNLKEVLPLKRIFEPRETSLSSDDWAELSGYLLDKYYGILAPSEEYLRYEIDGLRGLLMRAVQTNPNNPIAYYNLSKYFIESGENAAIENALQTAIEKFNAIPFLKKRDIYKYIDSYRLLGEQYIGMENYLQAQEQFSEGISLFVTERDNAGFKGTADIGKLYADMGNIKYSVSGDYDDALRNYEYSVELGNDTQSIRYRIGYIQYKKNNYAEALGAFMKTGAGNVKERNLMLAMANTLFMRDDNYAAEGYYSQLIDTLDREIEKRGIVFPQTSVKDYDIVNAYLRAANNYGVTLYNLAKRTGNSALNARAIVQFSQSLRAWDALTRNQETLVRLQGGNLAEQNIKYITHPIPEFEPSIYADIPKTLMNNEKL